MGGPKCTADGPSLSQPGGQEGFRPAKFFSIDRVFRNEAVDRTHLAEFHQIEGEKVRCPTDYVTKQQRDEGRWNAQAECKSKAVQR